jgi:hypothetical protein
MKQFEQRSVAGVEILVSFKGNQECLSMDLVFATKISGIQVVSCLIPHNLEDLGWRDCVSDTYKASAIQVLENWIAQDLLQPQEWKKRELYYSSSELRAYAYFWKIEDTLSIGSVSLLEKYCESCSIGDLLQGELSNDYMPLTEKQRFNELAKEWKESNASYLDGKAQELAHWWEDQLGSLGTSGDFMIDAIASWARNASGVPSGSANDKERLFKAIYDFAKNSFAEGCIPLLTTDYGIDNKIAKILEDANLSHLAKSFPMKAVFHLDFSDLKRPTASAIAE